MDDKLLNINEIVLKAVSNINIKEIIEKKVQETVTKTIESSIDEIFRNYSDFSKELKEKMKEMTKINYDNFDLPSYNMLIEKTIKENLENKITGKALEDLRQKINNMITGEVDKEYKLSDLIEKFKKDFRDDYEYEDVECIGFIIENSNATYTSDYKHIYLSPKKLKSYDSKYSYPYQIDITPEGRVYGLKIKERDVIKDFYTGHLSNWEGLMLRIQANEAKIIVDIEPGQEDDYTSYERQDSDDDY